MGGHVITFTCSVVSVSPHKAKNEEFSKTHNFLEKPQQKKVTWYKTEQSCLIFPSPPLYRTIMSLRVAVVSPSHHSSILCALLICITLYECHSLSTKSPSNRVIPPSNISEDVGGYYETNNQQFNSLSSIRIRSTKQDDLPTIIDLLAVESAPENDNSQKPKLFGNWNISMKKLKSEASLTLQLTHRHAVLEHASKVLSRYQEIYGVDHHFSMEEKRYALWGDDTFRNKLEKAAKTTSTWEGTIWDEWNFAYTPDQGMLQHFMFTAVDDDFIGSGNDQSPGIVGFCEVGICEIPELEAGIYVNDTGDRRDVASKKHIPCIGNLVVSPNHRRRGIGCKLVQSAIRLLKTYYSHSQNDSISSEERSSSLLGLYVDKDNLSAIRLYQHLGFEVSEMCSPKSENCKRIFMFMDVHLQNYTKKNTKL